MTTLKKYDNRRVFLKSALVLVGTGVIKSMLAEPICKLATPRQTEGPFYPLGIDADTDWDLTQIQGHKKLASGIPILVEGIIQDKNCSPIPNAIVEIWQACASGRYNHPNDHSQNVLDPNFQYRGIARTDLKGQYFFQTIMPGKYAVTSSWTRPPHIHFKVYAQGFKDLTTQLYFRGQPLNSNDRILQGVPEPFRDKVVKPISPVSENTALPINLIARQRIIFDIQLETNY
jgi:protocatechuate 3,4-dioxygenase, beta subunit